MGDVALVSGENKVGTHIGQRLEDKPPCRHARVRQDEGGRVDDQLAGIENVEIEGTRGVSSACGGASEFRLEAGELAEQVDGIELGAYFHHSVEK